ncbi:hypothetical protein FKX85_00380 [Echinicola soli]|uniref:Uncharacterized protein n=1 Tax=Echinicola soli TaxID=2591634 RepID=A0A514CCN5_9BACT|nr:hypothetical protein [Echinicola soli]QDH77577.1 hypothetical protein FKX85_00380 [Echinicola soli]
MKELFEFAKMGEAENQNDCLSGGFMPPMPYGKIFKISRWSISNPRDLIPSFLRRLDVEPFMFSNRHWQNYAAERKGLLVPAWHAALASRESPYGRF